MAVSPSVSKEIVRIFSEDLQGFAPMQELATRCIRKGIWGPDWGARAELKAAIRECRRALKNRVDGRLPFAIPTGSPNEPTWVQLDLTSFDDRAAYLLHEAGKVQADIRALRLIVDDTYERFQRLPPDLPSWLTP